MQPDPDASRRRALLILALLVFIGAAIPVFIMEVGPEFSTGDLPALVDSLEPRNVTEPVTVLSEGGDGEGAALLILNMKIGQSDGTPVMLSSTYEENGRRQVLWEREVETAESSSDVKLAFDNSHVYVNIDTTLQAWRQADGTLAWEASLSDRINSGCDTCMHVAGEKVIVLTTDRVLYGVDTATGEIAWRVRMNQEHPTTAQEGARPFHVIGNTIAIMDETVAGEPGTIALQLYDIGSGEVANSLAPICSDPGEFFPDSGLYMSSPTLIDESEGQAYFIFGSNVFHSPCVQRWDIASGEIVWQERLPEDVNPVESTTGLLTGEPGRDLFLRGEENLYFTARGPEIENGIFSINLENGRNHLLVEVQDYALAPLLAQDNVLIVRARRTRGTEWEEIWAVDTGTGERRWQHRLQGMGLMGVDSSRGEWLFHPYRQDLVILEMREDNVQVEALDIESGEILHQTTTPTEDNYLGAATWTHDTAYLAMYNLYTLDLQTGELARNWP